MGIQAVEVHGCPHCGTPVEGPQGSFCCHGCEAASELVHSAGLDAWYATREKPGPRVRSVEPIAWSRVPRTENADGTVTACVGVDGMTCSSCVWLTERVLERTPGVADAHVSYATGRATLRWDPAVVDLDKLTDRIAALGYQPRPTGDIAQVDRDLLLRLGVASFGAMNVMGHAVALYAGWFDGMDDRFVALFRWASLAVATPVVLWSATPFFRGAWQGLKNRVLHMDLPIALAVALLYAHGVWATLTHHESYLDSVTMLVALLLMGRLLEARGRKRTVEAAASLAAVVPRTARRARGDTIEEVSSEDLVPGDIVDLGSGQEVPADGVVTTGSALVRMAVLTGESRPIRVAAGDSLVAGAVIEDGAVRMGVTRTGDRTLVQQMAADLLLAHEAPRTPSPTDRIAPVFTAATLGVATATALLVHHFMGPDEALQRTVAVLVVACPCALALAGPLVGASGLGAAARRGLLVRSADTFEKLALVDTVVLDKTGTITWGTPAVVAADDAMLRVAAGLERFSRHPIASAIIEAAVLRGVAIPVAEDVQETAGVGIRGRVDGVAWTLRRGGPDRVAVESENGLVGWIVLEDRPRADAAEDVRAIVATGRQVILLTGDHTEVADRVARDVGVTRVVAEVDPRGKATFVEDLRAQGHVVLFVGDGLNDGPALAAADVGIAMASGAASSVLAADGILAGERLAPIAAALHTAGVVHRRVRVGIVRSLIYNASAVAAAVMGLVNPLVAAVLMPLSSGLVIASAAGVERAVARAQRQTP